jgi:hypothetical protein
MLTFLTEKLNYYNYFTEKLSENKALLLQRQASVRQLVQGFADCD